MEIDLHPQTLGVRDIVESEFGADPEEHVMQALMISGDRSGSGKTSITLAIAALLSRKMKVQTFKVGMDYIDPSYLSGVTGRPCRNLDTFVMNRGDLGQVFSTTGAADADLALVEGVRGLYEGAESLTDTGSSAAVAKALGLPVILVVSARSITRSAAAMVKGFQSFDPGVEYPGGHPEQCFRSAAYPESHRGDRAPLPHPGDRGRPPSAGNGTDHAAPGPGTLPRRG